VAGGGISEVLLVLPPPNSHPASTGQGSNKGWAQTKEVDPECAILAPTSHHLCTASTLHRFYIEVSYHISLIFTHITLCHTFISEHVISCISGTPWNVWNDVAPNISLYLLKLYMTLISGVFVLVKHFSITQPKLPIYVYCADFCIVGTFMCQSFLFPRLIIWHPSFHTFQGVPEMRKTTRVQYATQICCTHSTTPLILHISETPWYMQNHLCPICHFHILLCVQPIAMHHIGNMCYNTQWRHTSMCIIYHSINTFCFHSIVIVVTFVHPYLLHPLCPQLCSFIAIFVLHTLQCVFSCWLRVKKTVNLFECTSTTTTNVWCTMLTLQCDCRCWAWPWTMQSNPIWTCHILLMTVYSAYYIQLMPPMVLTMNNYPMLHRCSVFNSNYCVPHTLGSMSLTHDWLCSLDVSVTGYCMFC